MTITRRALLRAMAVAATTALIGAARALELPPGALLVYDSRLPGSRALSERHGGRGIDLAEERGSQWHRLRRLQPRGRVAGLTSWNDLVQVRAALEPKGLRVRAEARCGRLCYWEMA